MQIVGQGRTADIHAYGEGNILKLFHDDGPLAAREITIARRLQTTGLPVPAFIEEVMHEGRRGIVYVRIEGTLLAHQLAASPWIAAQLGRQMAEAHFAIHQHKLPELPAQKARLHAKIEAAASLPDSQKRVVRQRLDTLPDAITLCHNDFHPENIFITPHGPIVIDWVDATAGHALADVARSALILQIATPPARNILRRAAVHIVLWQLHSAYLARYFALSDTSSEQLRQWMLPVAAGRLSEAIPHEREPLLRLIDKLL